MVRLCIYSNHLDRESFILQVIDKAVECGDVSSQYPTNWILHSREKKPGKAFVDGLALRLLHLVIIIFMTVNIVS